MVGKNRKNNQKISYGGYKSYRTPKIFGGREIVEKKDRHFPWHLWKLVLGIIIVIGLAYWLFVSKTFQIRKIIIEGNQNVSNERLESYFKSDQNIFLFSSKELRKKILSENPEIKEVQIIRGIPDAVKLLVAEHENKLVWQVNGEKYLVSIQGKLTKQIDQSESVDYPVVIDNKNLSINLGDKIVSPSFVSFINNIYAEFFNYTNIKPTTFSVEETTFDVNLATEAGFYVKFNTMRSSEKQLDNLKKVLVAKRQDIKEYVDLRIDGWAYYK